MMGISTESPFLCPRTHIFRFLLLETNNALGIHGVDVEGLLLGDRVLDDDGVEGVTAGTKAMLWVAIGCILAMVRIASLAFSYVPFIYRSL